MNQPPSIPAPATVAALEKIPHAARRMGVSVSSLYRIIKRGDLCLVKVGERASAVSVSAVDGWIAARIAAATKEGGR